jgi:prepilin-type N-terminal cleavage/methylation domain-containing protein
MKKYSKSGFTLVEIVLVFVLIGILISITTPLVVETVQRADLTAAHESLYNSLIRAQKLSQSQTNGQVWGVCLDEANNRYIIAAGTCASRNTLYDEIVEIAPSITISGTSIADTISFAAITGNNTNTWSSVILTNGKFSKTITIDESGIIDKQ